ncbi:MAG: hypothetical protein Ct9H300mP22_3990 [Gammaproteobacteria bacterium]|nr:MAG: hypothetical protein Ct9H300mP22_3990 [Gammaproteobacteria bacterium]
MADMFIECQLARSIVVMAAMQLDSSADELKKQNPCRRQRVALAKQFAM